MESRAKYSRTYRPPGPMSRTIQDLAAYLRPSNSAEDSNPEFMLRRLLPKGRKPRVCVVGAGIAGLRCAQYLGEKGVDVIIFEARDRVGGRVGRSKKHGPNWIHGLKQNPILDLAKQLDETLMDVPEAAPTMFDPAGMPLEEEEAGTCFGMMWEIVEEAFKYSNEKSASIPQDQSLLDFFKIRLREKEIPKATADRVLLVGQQWGDYVGGSIERQSLKYFWLEETIDGGNVFLASTYKAILDHITKGTLSKAKLQLSTKVISIISQASQQKQSSENSPSVTVTTSQNTTLQFDEVVMTAPLGWLKRNTQIFDPPLPPRLLQSITNMTYGRLEKVYLTFPSAFWQPSPGAKTENNPFFNQWLRPDYTPNHWPTECVFLSSLPGPYAHPTLLFYMHGPLAAHITTLASALEPGSPDYVSRLAAFFKPYYSRLPHYIAHENNCVPTHALATNWSNDEFAGWGSYTNFQISEKGPLVELDKDIEALRQGCPERGVWIAGEH
ncbi:MAG: hypothetical protein Q9222_007364, partial [Ikaeria aurantiellina]